MTRRAALWFSLVSLIWGTGYMWNEFALRELSPLPILVLRMIFGAAVMAVVVAVTRPTWPRAMPEWLALLGLGVGNLALPQFLITWGQQHVDSAVAAILIGATPLLTVVVAHLFLPDDRVTPSKIAGVSLGFAGIVLLIAPGWTEGWSGTLAGQLAMLGAALCFAVSSVMARRYAAAVPAQIQALVATVVAGLIFAVAAPALGESLALPGLPLTWAAVASLGLLVNGVALALFYHLLATIGPSRTQMVSYVFPLVAIVLGVAVLHEPLYWELLAGGGLILAGVFLFDRGRKT